MANFRLAIKQGNPGALKLAKTLLTTPTLINMGQAAETAQGMPFAIPLETEEHSQTGTAQVSESLVITKTQKVNVSDNIAPGAWTWNLSGYIPGIAALEPSNYFTPFVTLFTKLLQNAYKKGYVLIFKDIDATIYKRVVIQSLTVRTQADCKNKTPFRMVLKEINVMDLQAIEKSESETSALPDLGSALGLASSAGLIIASAAGVSATQAVTALNKK